MFAPSAVSAWISSCAERELPNPRGTARTPEQIANWDAGYIVNGTVNEDSVHAFSPRTPQLDGGYTVEMRFNPVIQFGKVSPAIMRRIDRSVSKYPQEGCLIGML